MAEAAEVSKAVQEALAASAGRLGYHYGTGVGDLARVLRVPGTVNRKTTTERPCRLLDATGRSYSSREFADQVLPMAENRCGPRPPRLRPVPGAAAGPFDMLAQRASWADILEPAGYTFVRREFHGGELWRRPCDPDDMPSSEYSVRCQVHGVPVAVNFSEAGPLPVGEGHRLTKGRVFAQLYHGGDERAAARDLIAASRGDSSATSVAAGLPEEVLREIRAVADGESAAATAPDPGHQQEPLPLVDRHTLPDFPVDALPDPVKDMVLAVAEATQTDPGMAGTTALAMLAVAAGGCMQIEAKRGWREPLNLYTAVVAGPGERKSAVQALMTQPLVEAERALVEEGRKERFEIETAREIAHKAAEKARRNAVRADGEARERLTKEAIQLAQVADAMPVPVVPRLLADDVTPEACASLLAEQDGRLGIVSAEGGIFDVIAGRYSGNIPVLDVWLKGHSGDALRVDRKGREPEYVRRPALTLALMIQPIVLAAVAQNRTLRGRGLVARFLFALPASKVGRRNPGADAVPEQVSDAYSKCLRTLVEELAGWKSDPATLRLDDHAAAYLLQIQRRVEGQLDTGGVLYYIIDWGAKRVGATLRIAGLLHLAARPTDGWRHPIPLDVLQRADQIMEYYQNHAIEAFAAMKADPVIADAEYLLGRIAHLGKSIVSTRDLHTQTSRSRFPKVTDLHPVLDILEQHGYVARMPETAYAGVGRRPSPRWSVHPHVLAGSSASL